MGLNIRILRTLTPERMMRGRLRDILSCGRRGQSGMAAVEFAMILPAFLVLLLEATQVGLYFYVSASLNSATTTAARQILIGSVTNQGLTAAQFRSQVLCPLLPAAMPCSNIITNIETVPEATNPGGFYALLNASQTGLAQPTMNNNQTSFCSGTPGATVFVQVYYAMPVMSPIWLANATTWNGSKVAFVSAVSVFKNEPFISTTQSSC